jgi:hypothetical protein
MNEISSLNTTAIFYVTNVSPTIPCYFHFQVQRLLDDNKTQVRFLMSYNVLHLNLPRTPGGSLTTGSEHWRPTKYILFKTFLKKIKKTKAASFNEP